jgi:hypothetical protein
MQSVEKSFCFAVFVEEIFEVLTQIVFSILDITVLNIVFKDCTLSKVDGAVRLEIGLVF